VPAVVDPLLPVRVALPPWGTSLRRWGISLASIASGTATLAVFRRGVPHVGWIVGYVVVLWLLFLVLGQVRAVLLARGRRGVVAAGDYTIQTLYHGLLLFVLPGYFASTTFDAVTVVFFALLAAAALLTTVDPWYHALVHPRPWLGVAFFGFSLFAGLNVALPLVGVAPAGAVVGSAILAALGLAPTVVARDGLGMRSAWRAGAVVTVAGLAAWAVRPAIPPAPLSLVRPTLARDVLDLEPVNPVTRVTMEDLRAWGGLVAFTPVAAPATLRQPIEHRWRHGSRVISTVRLPTAVRGGRFGGFRTYSRKTDFPPTPYGRWTVDVVTASGQLIGRVRFRVDP
jgi:hypothetical protein